MESRGTGVSAIVEFDYAANESDELSLVKGDILTNIKTQPGGWWHGVIASTGKSGMFPDNFVKLLEHNHDDKVILRDKTAKNRRCKVIYSYKENKDDELTLAVGDLIEVFEEIEEGWWRGKLGAKVGVFPSNFVEIIDNTSPISSSRKSINNTILQNKINNNRSSMTSSREDLVSHNSNSGGDGDVPILPPKPIREQCKVLYAYAPLNEDELKLTEGDIINIVTKELPDKGWWKGELRGKIGVFPDNFVTLLPLPTDVAAVKPPIGTKIINTSSASLRSNTTTITSSAFRKNSFGSKDSLNESTNNMINAEQRNSGIFGNVAAHRRSLESKTHENSIEKPPRKSLIITDANKTPSDIRKSLENLDEGKKTSTPPPVLTKKPTVPIKKSPSVSTVAGSIFSGLKQKVKSVESKLHAAHDGTDGTGSSKMTVADNGEKNVVGEKINELDTVERGTGYLQDVRQNRAKAPKRRPPTHASGDSNNNVSMNGSHGESNDSITHEVVQQLDEEQVKPRAREWEKHKAPWMEELKANQARKTSPNIEHKTTSSPDDEKHDMSKSFSSSFSHPQQQPQATQKSEIRASSLEMMKSNSFREESQSAANKSTTKISITENSSSVMTSSSSLSSSPAKVATTIEETTTANNLRPTSVSLRNRSISPIPRINHVIKPSSTPTNNVTATHITATPPTISAAHHTAELRCNELEQRVNKLETLITAQNATIEELRKMLKDESDKVKTLKSDLEKYAQCFTQDKKPTSKIFINNFNKH